MPYGLDACCVRETAHTLLEICVRLNRRTGVGRVPAAKVSDSSCALLAAAVRSSVINSCLVLDALVFLSALRNGVSKYVIAVALYPRLHCITAVFRLYHPFRVGRSWRKLLPLAILDFSTADKFYGLRYIFQSMFWSKMNVLFLAHRSMAC